MITQRAIASLIVAAASQTTWAVPVTYTYELVSETIPSVETGSSYWDSSINDQGDISYITQQSVLDPNQRVTNKNTVGRIQNGVEVTLHSDVNYLPGPRFDSQYLNLSMNNGGDVGFRLRGPNSSETVMWEAKGGINEAEPVFIATENRRNVDLNDNGLYARGYNSIGRETSTLIGASSGQVVFGSNINNNDTLATASFNFGGDGFIDVFQTTGTTSSQATITLQDAGALFQVNPHIRLNNRDSVAFTTTAESGFQIQFASPFTDPSVFTVSNNLTDGISAVSPYTGINDLNSILFSGADLNNSASHAGLYMVSSDGSNLRKVVDFNDLEQFDIGNSKAVAIEGSGGSSLIDDERLNNKEEVLFSVLYSDGASRLFRADPLAGSTPLNPILPEVDSGSDPLNPDGSWDIPVTSCASLRRCFIDPEYATGYEYTLSAPEASFGSVFIPTPLSGGDGLFEILFDGVSETLYAGQTFNFTDYFLEGVSSFIIQGIDLNEMLDPTDPSAFVTGLSFLGNDHWDFSVNMNPLTELIGEGDTVAVSEPQTIGLTVLGLLGLFASRRISLA